MDIAVLGGGPGGLYFAILIKRDLPSARVRVVERNRPDETFGFGVAFHAMTLRKLAEADPVSQAALLDLLRPWDDVFMHVGGLNQRVSGHQRAGCSRHALLLMLQERAMAVGVELEFERQALPQDFPEADLVVAADGSSSRTRAQWADHFEPRVDERPNRYVWLGTTRPMDAINFFFNEQPEGIFVAHAYPHSPDQGTWIVETDHETFEHCGIRADDERDTVELVERIFQSELDGHHVVARGSNWRRFPLISCKRWVRDNVVLLGDAKGTVHYSIGSGTKLAMEDAVALHDALLAQPTISRALAAYEEERRTDFTQLQSMGYGSMLWFEHIPSHWPMSPARFIFSALTRKTDETYDSLTDRVPALVQAAAAELEGGPAGTLPGGSSHCPLEVPLRMDGFQLGGRLVIAGSNGKAPEGLVAALSLADPVELDGSAPVGEDELSARAAGACGGQPVGLVVQPAGLPRTSPLGGPIAGALERVGRLARSTTAVLLILDLSAWGWPAYDPASEPGHTAAAVADEGPAREAIAAIRAGWGADRPLAVRVSAPAQPTDALATVAAFVGDGCSIVDVSGRPTGTGLLDRQLLLADMVRQELGAVALVGGLTTIDEANTVLTAGRADLVLL
jgi:2-polyprenyl-6-methoxyphenol hydroxylase-like FAD-dependent oxidoreductase